MSNGGGTVISVHDSAGLRDELSRRVADGDGLSGIDKQLLELADNRLSGEEISAKMHERGIPISAERAMQRIRNITKERGWLSIVEQKSLLLDGMIELKSHLQDIVRSEGGTVTDKNGNEFYSFGDPRWSAVLVRLFKEINEIINDGVPKVEDEKVQIRSSHAKVMGKSVEMGFQLFMDEISMTYDIDEGVAREIMERMMVRAFHEIDSRVAE